MSKIREYGKNLIWAITMAIIASVIIVVPVKANTNNHSFDTAQSFNEAGEAVDFLLKDDRGSIIPNYYCYTAQSDGYVTFEFKQSGIVTNSNGWNYYIYDKNLVKIDGGSFYNGQTYTSHQWLLRNQDKIYIKIDGFNVNNIQYKIKASLTEQKDWQLEDNEIELEGNDSMTYANGLTKTVVGELNISSDVDWYKYTATQDGYVKFTGKKFGLGSFPEWNMDIYDESGVKIRDYYFDSTITCETQLYLLRQNQSIYIKIRDFGFASGYMYTVTPDFTSLSNQLLENENNDVPANATEFTNNIYGELFTSSDIDYYKYTAPETGYYKFKTDRLFGNTGSWNINVYNNVGDNISSNNQDAVYINAGETVNVKVSNSSSAAGVIYILSVHKHEVTLVNAKEATCTETGYTGDLYCAACNLTVKRGETTSAKGHTVVEDPAVEATCAAEGKSKGSHCSVCGKVITAQSAIPKKAHTWSKWKVTKQPTISRTGSQKRTCSVCGYVEVKAMSKLKPTAKLSSTKQTVKAGKYYILKISKLAKGDAVKSVTAPKSAKLTIKKIKTNQYKITGKKKGTYKVTVTLKSKKKYICRITIK